MKVGKGGGKGGGENLFTPLQVENREGGIRSIPITKKEGTAVTGDGPASALSNSHNKGEKKG